MSIKSLTLNKDTKLLLTLYKRNYLISFIFYVFFILVLFFLYQFKNFFWQHSVYLFLSLLSGIGFFVLGIVFPPMGWLKVKLPRKISKDIIEEINLEGQLPSRFQLVAQLNLDKDLAKNVESILRIDYGVDKEIVKLNKISEKILNTADKFGGILSLSKAMLDIDEPLGDLKMTLRHLKRQNVIEEIDQNIYDFKGVREFSQEDEKIIKYAEKKNGKFTIEEIVKELPWSRKKIEVKLKELEQKGVALKDVKVGTVQWYFPGLISKKGGGTTTAENNPWITTSFDDNDKIRNKVYDMINQAETHIIITSYLFTDPILKDNKTVLQILEKRAQQDIDIVFLLGRIPPQYILKRLDQIESLRVFHCPRIHTNFIGIDKDFGILFTGDISTGDLGNIGSKQKNFEIASLVRDRKLIQTLYQIIRKEYCQKEKCERLAQKSCKGLTKLL